MNTSEVVGLNFVGLLKEYIILYGVRKNQVQANIRKNETNFLIIVKFVTIIIMCDVICSFVCQFVITAKFNVDFLSLYENL